MEADDDQEDEADAPEAEEEKAGDRPPPPPVTPAAETANPPDTQVNEEVQPSEQMMEQHVLAKEVDLIEVISDFQKNSGLYKVRLKKAAQLLDEFSRVDAAGSRPLTEMEM